MAELPHPLRSPEVLQAVRAEVTQVGVVRKAVGDQVAGGAGENGLAAVGDRPQAGAADDRPPDVVVVAPQLGLAGVQGDPDPQRLASGPGLVGKGALGVEGGGDRIGGLGEGAHHAVALALLHRPHPAVEGDGGIEELVVAGDGRAHGVLVALPQAGRSLDVAEEERDDPGGQRGDSRPPPSAQRHPSWGILPGDPRWFPWSLAPSVADCQLTRVDEVLEGGGDAVLLGVVRVSPGLTHRRDGVLAEPTVGPPGQSGPRSSERPAEIDRAAVDGRDGRAPLACGPSVEAVGVLDRCRTGARAAKLKAMLKTPSWLDRRAPSSTPVQVMVPGWDCDVDPSVGRVAQTPGVAVAWTSTWQTAGGSAGSAGAPCVVNQATPTMNVTSFPPVMAASLSWWFDARRSMTAIFREQAGQNMCQMAQMRAGG